MRYELDRGAHSVYALQHHLVQVVKYRKKVLEDGVVEEISESFGGWKF